MAILGPEFIVNSTTAGNQNRPLASQLADGNLVFTWSDTSTHARLFASDGLPLASDFTVDSSSGYVFGLDALSTGGFVAISQVTTGFGAPTSMIARVYSDDGLVLNDGVEVQSTRISRQYGSDAIALSDGGFVAIWKSNDLGDGSHGCIRARLFGEDGKPQGKDFIVNSSAEGVQHSPAIAALPSGGFVATWTYAGIRARLFEADGTARGPDFLVNSTPGAVGGPKAIALANGNFVLTWGAATGDGSEGCIRGRIYDEIGTPLGADFVLNSTKLGNQAGPLLATLPDGGFVAAWTSADGEDGSAYCIRARFFNMDGTARGTDFIVNATAEGGPSSIETLSDGKILITWGSPTGDGSDGCIRAIIIDSSKNGIAVEGTSEVDTVTGSPWNDALSENR